MSNNASEETNTMSEENDSHNCAIEIMLSVKYRLELMPFSKRGPEYVKILEDVMKYLHKHCKHDIVDDLIDIDPDRSQTIYYCTICGNTF